MTTRVLLADDHDIVRAGLRSLIEQQPDWEICGEACTGREAISMTAQLHPDIVVMDFSMPELNGLEATRQIRRASPETEVLIFTANETEKLLREVFEAGAHAYLLKSEASQHLLPALTALRKHRTYFSSENSEIVFGGYLKGEPGVTLTPRERETVQLIAEGKSNKEIAATFGISVKTVETHRATIMRKLKLGSVADLVRYAVRNGIIEA